MRIYTTLFLILLGGVTIGQEKLSDRIYFGGGGGFSAGSNQTNISVFPQVGYKITDNYSAGVGITYQYVRIKQPVDASLSNYGWSVFNRYNILQTFFAYAEFERLSFEFFVNPALEQKERSGYNSLLLGGGYTERLAGRASFNVMALYNVLYDESDPFRPYNSPWVIRAGVGVDIF